MLYILFTHRNQKDFFCSEAAFSKQELWVGRAQPGKTLLAGMPPLESSRDITMPDLGMGKTQNSPPSLSSIPPKKLARNKTSRKPFENVWNGDGGQH